MSFNSQLDGFVKGFAVGYDMTESQEEREAAKQKKRANQLLIEKAEREATPEAIARAERAAEADVAQTEANTARLNALVEDLPRTRAREEAESESLISSRKSEEGWREAATEELTIKNRRAKNILKAIDDTLKKRLGKGSTSLGGFSLVAPEEPASAVPAAGTPTPAPATPGPTSAVEVPASATSTYDPDAESPAPDPGSDELNPEGVAEAVPLSTGERANVEQQADRTGERANAYEYVDEQQGQVAGIRKQPLDPATRDVLQHAGSQTGVRAVVYSGGQHAKGEKGPRTGSTRHDHGMAADVRLYDAETGRMLDMRDPDDAERMKAFGAAAVQAGATGIGAGEGYMGPHSMHIGFGKDASWGGASWIEAARKDGLSRRGAMPVAGGPKETEGPGGSRSLVMTSHEAVKAGLESAAMLYGLNNKAAVGTPEYEQAMQDMLLGTHGADAEQVDAAEAAVEEMAGEQLSEAELPFYTLGATWKAYNDAGEPEEAKKAAMGLLGHYQQVSAQWAAVAKAAASNGDIDKAVEAAVKAYANVPDGYEMRVNKKGGKYEVLINEIGSNKTLSKTLQSPEEMGAMAMGINPGSFFQFISQAAGVREGEGGKDKGFSVEERESAATAIDTALAGFKEAHSAQSEALHFDDPEKSLYEDIKPVAAQIVLRNDRIQSDRALRAAVNLVTEGPSSPPEELGNGLLKVHVAGIAPFDMHIDDYSVLALVRDKVRGQADQPEKPSEGLGRVTDALQGIFSTPESAVPEYNPSGRPAGAPVYDPNLPNPLMEIGKNVWGGLTAVPTGPVPPFDPSGGTYTRPRPRP